MRYIDSRIVTVAIRHQLDKFAPGTSGYRLAETVLRYVEKRANASKGIDIVFCSKCSCFMEFTDEFKESTGYDGNCFERMRHSALGSSDEENCVRYGDYCSKGRVRK